MLCFVQPNDSDPGWEEVKDATTTPPEVHEAEVELSIDTQLNWLFGNLTVPEDNTFDEYSWENPWGLASFGDGLFADRDEGLTIALTNP
jgi:hypothetical protein